MSQIRPFSYDPFTRVEKLWHDDGNGNYHLESIQHGTQHLELTKEVFNSFDERAPWNDDLNHVASIPPIIAADLQARGVFDSERETKRWLNNRDNRMFRTRPGVI